MSFRFSPSIVQSGLVLYLDSANTRSYVGGSTTWTDLSRNGNNGTLINGPTFNNANGGSLVFNGTDEYGTIPYDSDFNLSSTDYTLEGWFNSNNFGSGQQLITKDTYGSSFDWCLFIPNSTSLAIFSNATTTNVTATVPTMNTGRWYHFVVTSISGTIRIYLNSVLYQTGIMSTSNASQVKVTIGCAGWNSPNGFMNGKIPILRVYRKGLTSGEVLQNYNATKTRFGL
jgi:hypothetical protein